ncbi:SusC/RagA family TonB-linked outer membrane protein [Parabacteroides pacaensis]|uniref:SusC/RagA family TonB-linked outer membrane protein n=1 Tax=Parabacteroides pacaensis TaxID=2086575 RepID=UPI000D0F56EF|nr:SusC/RagA family TonB-linked outer membrane protein [Parabacteroides pacaensis]
MKKHVSLRKKYHLISVMILFVLSLSFTQSLKATEDYPSSPTLPQKNYSIKGIVKDKSGETIPGANVIVKGTTTGIITDQDGAFELSLPDNNATLVVSFIGYKTTEIKVANQPFVNIELTPNVEELTEVVVTALGIKREKKALGYAMQEVKTEALTENKTVSVANMLQGKIAGVQIAQSGTGMGGSTRIVMRGLNSLSGNNQPLWVIDGFPVNDESSETANQWGGIDREGAASQINPENIESISVLKGANAAALYGSRAQNGAIVITTKKGRQGQPLQLEYNGTITFDQAYNPYEYQNVYGQGSGGTFNMEQYGSWGPKMEGQTIPNWRNVKYGDTRYTDYAMLPQKDFIKEFYQTGVNYTNTLTASAGSENLTGRFSFTDSRNEGITPNHSLNKQYYDLNTEFRNRILTVGAKINFMRQETKNAPGQGEYGNMIQLIKMPRSIRLQDLRDPVGTDGHTVNWTGPKNDYANPYALTMPENGNNLKRNRLIGQINASARITSFLKLTGRVGIDWYQDQKKNFNQITDPTASGSQYSNIKTEHQEFNADIMLNFDKTFGAFSVTANLGAATMNNQYNGLTGDAGMFIIPNLVSLANGETHLATEGYWKKEIHSVFGNATLGYNSMLYLDVTARNDWSSTLPPTNRSYFYPSVSLSGIVSEMITLPEWITYLKVRGSWAKVGNDTNPYKLSNVYSIFTDADNVNKDILKVKLSDTFPLYDLKPEETNSYEAGVDARFLDGRLGIDFTYYSSNTINQILSVGIPSSSGYTSKSINAGKMKSSGYELMLSGTPVLTKDWKWDINLNWGMNRTECVRLDEKVKRFTLGTTRVGSVVVDEGGKFGDIVAVRAYQRDGNGNILIGNDGLPLYETDKVIGNMLPKWTGSIGTNLQWKGLSFAALVDIRYGGNFISMTDNYASTVGTSARTLFGRDGMVVEGMNHETGLPNTVKVTAEDYYSSIGGYNGVAEAFMYDGTYVKMRELSLGYRLPSRWMKKTFLQSAKISFVARDLFYFYKNAPVNPEGAFSREDYAQAFEFGTMPPTRSFGFTLNIKY